MKPGRQLHAGCHQTTMRSDDGLRLAGRSAAHQQDCGIVRRGVDLTAGTTIGSMAKTILEPLVAWLELDAVPTLLFLEKREQHAEQRGKVFLDARGDDALDRCP